MIRGGVDHRNEHQPMRKQSGYVTSRLLCGFSQTKLEWSVKSNEIGFFFKLNVK